MPGIPDGWTYSTQVGAGVTAEIALAAAAGIAHVLTDIHAIMLNVAAGVATAINIQVLDNTSGIFVVGMTSGPDTGNFAGVDLSGLQLATEPGHGLSVGYNQVTPVGYVQGLIIQGYDV